VPADHLGIVSVADLEPGTALTLTDVGTVLEFRDGAFQMESANAAASV